MRIERQVIIMAGKRTLDERIQEKDNLMQQLLTKAKQYEAQIKQLEKRKKEEERRARTHRLITMGGVVSSVLNRDFVEGDDMRLMNFLKAQEKNGNYFSKAMNKGAPDMAKKSDGQAHDYSESNSASDRNTDFENITEGGADDDGE